jgi:nucleotide-binding universal stress UspA family protein
MENMQPLFRQIIVPIDGSQFSLSAGKLALKIACRDNSKIVFLFVIDNSVAEELSSSLDKTIDQAKEDMEANARQYLNYLSRRAEESNLEATQEIRTGIPYIVIDKVIREREADLVIMGQTSRSGTRRMLIGSVAQRVLELAPCPVLIVKGK